MPRFSIRGIALLIVGGAAFITIIAIANVHRPGTGSALERCEQNMKSVSVAIVSYANVQSAFPQGTCPKSDLTHEDRLSWVAVLSNFYYQADNPNGIEWAKAWNVGENAKIARFDLRNLRCPELPPIAPAGPLPTTYIGIAGVGIDAPLLPKSDPRAGAFGYDRVTLVADFRDGTTNTMLLAETDQVSGSWLQGGPATQWADLDPWKKPYLGPNNRQFGGLHVGTSCVAM